MEIVLKTDTVVTPGADTQSQPEEKEVIVCANCNNRVTDPDLQIQVNANFTHFFANPHGHVFEIGCFSGAPGCMAASTTSDEFTWFPGYSWQIGSCRRCMIHLGWVFTSKNDKFYGLILEKLIFP